MKIVTVLGARPQFIKAAAVSRTLRGRGLAEVLVHTGQHYDENMSKVFFEELALPRPDVNLGIGSGPHGEQTGRMLSGIEGVLRRENPDIVLVYGDTNSTLAGALAAAKLQMPAAHVEAGMRSFNRRMPEEINRVVADHVASILLCSSLTAVKNLKNEGITDGVHLVGDVMYDVALQFKERATKEVSLGRWNLKEKGYVLSTVHRAENTDQPERLRGILTALREIARSTPVVLPLHPRTRRLLREQDCESELEDLTVIEPVSYLEMTRLEAGARTVLTDSGGVQKEAFFLRVPCLTLRDETEWVETVEAGWNQVCGAEAQGILKAWKRVCSNPPRELDPRYATVYGDGRAAQKIVDILAGGRR